MDLTKYTIGDIIYFEDKNEIIVKGEFNRLPAIVKRVKKTTEIGAILEILNTDHDPNLQVFYGYESNPTHYIIALETCTPNLMQFISSPTWKKFKVLPLLKMTTKGLKFLHDKKIVHGNLNPKNVLVSPTGEVAKICNIRLDGELQDLVRNFIFLSFASLTLNLLFSDIQTS